MDRTDLEMPSQAKTFPLAIADDPDLWADIRDLVFPVLVEELGRAFELGFVVAVLEIDASQKAFSDRLVARARAMLLDFLDDQAIYPPGFETRAKLDQFITANYATAFWESWNLSQQSALRTALTRGNLESLGVDGVAKLIEPMFGRARAELIAATEMTNLMGIANQAAYRQVGFGEWEWRTAADSRVDPVCEALDGEVFNMAIQFSAAHPRCRCWPVPVPDSLPPPAFIPPPGILAT